MAFGSLMLDGCDVRISGQDVGRGTFSHRWVGVRSLFSFRVLKVVLVLRHAMLVDQTTEKVVVPLNSQLESQGRLELANSTWTRFYLLVRRSLRLTLSGSLSEMAVLGVRPN